MPREHSPLALMRAAAQTVAACSLLLVAGCGDGISCGDDTRLANGVCVANPGSTDTGSPDVGTDVGSDLGSDIGTDTGEDCPDGEELVDGECQPVFAGCGETDIEYEGECYSTGTSDIFDLVRWANAQSTVDQFTVVSADIVGVDSAPFYVGYPARVSVEVDLVGEPMRTDIYVGLETQDGEESCLLGPIEIGHQLEAIDAATAANSALLAELRQRAQSSFAVCERGEACEREDEVCSPMVAVEPDTEEERVEWTCIVSEDPTPIQMLSPADIAGASAGYYELEADMIIEPACANLAEEDDVNLWFAFDPFERVQIEGRDPVELPEELTEDAANAFVRAHRTPYSECGLTDTSLEPPGCATARFIEPAPGIDFWLRDLTLNSAMLTSIEDPAEADDDASVTQVTVGTVSSVYGVDEETALEFLDETTDFVFTVQPDVRSLVLPNDEDARAEFDPTDIAPLPMIVIRTELNRDGEPTIEELEQLLLDSFRGETLRGSQFSLGYGEDALEAISTGNWRWYEAFELRACAQPDYDEPEWPGLGSQNNCRSLTLLNPDSGGLDTVGGPLESIGGGSSDQCTDDLIARYRDSVVAVRNAEVSADPNRFFRMNQRSIDNYQVIVDIHAAPAFDVDDAESMADAVTWMFEYYCAHSINGTEETIPFGRFFVADMNDHYVYGWPNFTKRAGATGDGVHSYTEWIAESQSRFNYTSSAIAGFMGWTELQGDRALYCTEFLDRVDFYEIEGEVDGDVGEVPQVVDATLTPALRDELVRVYDNLYEARLNQNALWAEVQTACTSAPWHPANYEDGGRIFPSLVDGWQSPNVAGLQLQTEVGILSDIHADEESDFFKLEIGPSATVTLASTGSFQFLRIEHIMQAQALLHAQSKIAGSIVELKMHAFTVDIYGVEFTVPDAEFPVPQLPTFSRDVEKCRIFNVGIVPLEVCAGVSGELGVETAVGLEGGFLLSENPTVVAEVSGSVTPFLNIGAFGSLGLTLGFATAGLRLEIDPLVGISFPLEAAVDTSLMLAREVDISGGAGTTFTNVCQHEQFVSGLGGWGPNYFRVNNGAAETYNHGHNSWAYLIDVFTLDTPGELSFDVDLDAEPGDVFWVYVEGGGSSEQYYPTVRSGRVAFPLPAGEVVVQITYQKNGRYSSGADRLRVDNLVVTGCGGGGGGGTYTNGFDSGYGELAPGVPFYGGFRVDALMGQTGYNGWRPEGGRLVSGPQTTPRGMFLGADVSSISGPFRVEFDYQTNGGTGYFHTHTDDRPNGSWIRGTDGNYFQGTGTFSWDVPAGTRHVVWHSPYTNVEIDNVRVVIPGAGGGGGTSVTIPGVPSVNPYWELQWDAGASVTLDFVVEVFGGSIIGFLDNKIPWIPDLEKEFFAWDPHETGFNIFEYASPRIQASRTF